MREYVTAAVRDVLALLCKRVQAHEAKEYGRYIIKEYGSYIITVVWLAVALAVGLRLLQPSIADTLRHTMTDVANSL